MKKIKMPDLTIYKLESGYEGYDTKELYEWMRQQGLAKKWEGWAQGITGAIVDGHFIVYTHDVESFLSGEPNLD